MSHKDEDIPLSREDLKEARALREKLIAEGYEPRFLRLFTLEGLKYIHQEHFEKRRSKS